MNTNPKPRSSLPLFLWLGYVIFVVYAALVPLQYHALSLHEAWAAFQKIPYVELSIDLHADLIANGVLYVPVAFLTTYFLTQTFQKAPLLLLLAIAGAFSAAMAVAVEFTQLFFPPRTVKLNDILSEWLGSLVGLALATRYLRWLQTLLRSFWNDPQRLKTRLLEAYAFAYLAFSLFPYDILLSWPELEAKIHSGSWGWLLARGSPGFVLTGLQLLAELVLTAPFGILLVRLLGGSLASYKRAALMGILLGGFIEVAQFFLYSGISQGLSVLTRALGVCCGVALCRYGDRWSADHVAFILRRYTIPLGAVYLLALLYINRWFVSSWHGLDFAAEQLAKVNFVPFYYHYYAGEAHALFTLFTVCLSYVPIALLAWAYRRSAGFAVLVSLLLAMGVEVSKLFLQPGHPDPTSLLLACVASWLTVTGLRQVFQNASQPTNTPLRPCEQSVAIHDPLDCRVADASRNDDTPPRHCQRSAAMHAPFPIWLLLCLAATGVWATTFPAFPVLVCLVLIACAAAVWRSPVWLFAIVPAALPVFDLAPWSGRFFLDEFDALLFVGLTVASFRAPTLPPHGGRGNALVKIATMLLALSFAISAVRGMLPFQLPDVNSFNNYYSPYNALRIVKGAVWAFLIFWFSRRFETTGADVRRAFAWGMAVGLGLTVAVVLWERVAFSGLWNFTDGYRVTGPFSAMHLGGAYIECFLAVATPFLIVIMLEKERWRTRVVGIMLLLATTYALMVTFSRNGYSAFAVAVAVVLLAALVREKRFVKGAVISAALVGAMLFVAVPIFKGEFAQSRMASVKADFGVRQAHWDDALNIRDPGWFTALFGMGLGRYPETNFWRSTEGHRSGAYRFVVDKGNTFLRLSAGDSLYLDQLVSVEPDQSYVLRLDARSSVPNARITVPICEKWMLTSYNCIWQSLELGKKAGDWVSLESRFTTKGLSISPWYSQRPVKFTIFHPGPVSILDVDNVRLENDRGVNVLRNGDFSNGLDNWFFSVDGHLQWHIKSLFYGVLFDQGWFGLLALGAFFTLALGTAARRAYSGDTFAAAGLAALSSFLVVGLFDTLIDAPRFLLLFLLLNWYCFNVGAARPSDSNTSNLASHS